MAKEIFGKNPVRVPPHPVDNTQFFYSDDISSVVPGANVYLDGFSSKEVAAERVMPVKFISVSAPEGMEGRIGNDLVFYSFKDANRYLREQAAVAPSLIDGCDRFMLDIEWENKNEGMFKGFTGFSGYIYVTKEMRDCGNIVERAVTIRDMYDAGILRPRGIDDKQWAEKKEQVMRFMPDRDYLVSALRHMEGLNGQFLSMVKEYEKGLARNNGVSLKVYRQGQKESRQQRIDGRS